MPKRLVRISLAFVLAASPLSAQLPDTTPLLRGGIRKVPAADVVSAMTFGVSNEFFVLSSGRIMVHDGSSRSVVLVDADLKTATVVFDSSSPGPLRYPRSGPSRLFRARGDTGYFLDPAERGFRVISPEGKVVRRQLLAYLSNVAPLTARNSKVEVDAQGRVITMQIAFPVAGAAPSKRALPESAFIVRITPEKRGRDTIAVVKNRIADIRDVKTAPSDSPGGRSRLTGIQEAPIVDVGDAWTMTSTGRIAILRASDLHVDWMEPDGAWRATPPLPWPRLRIPPAQKASGLESVRRDAEKMQRVTQGGGNVVAGVQLTIVVDDSVPDFVPSFIPMTAWDDPAGGFWVRLGVRSLGRTIGPPVYALIDANGREVDRMLLPERVTVAGATETALYFVVPGASRMHFERVPWKSR